MILLFFNSYMKFIIYNKYMGIERFFKSINSLYANEIIKPLYKNNNITQFYFDFNSVIHKVSNTIVNHLNDMLLYSLVYRHLAESGMDPDLLIDEYKSINKIYELNYTIEEFYKYTKAIKLNEIIFEHILKNINEYLSYYPNCKLLYIGIDGVPSVGKMIEQQDRRYKGYLMGLINKKLKEKYLHQLDNSTYDFTNIYNELEYLNSKFSFDKNLISPQTDFMIELVEFLTRKLKLVNDLDGKTVNEVNGLNRSIIISDFNEPGEGEKKIILHIKKHSKSDDKIIIYSPDADMIIMSMIIPNYVYILRHEQSESRDDIIDIQSIRNIFKPVDEIAYIFSVFGDDFIPKIEWINVVKHLPKIIEDYKKLNIKIINDNKVNFKNLQLFFKSIKKFETQFKPSRNRFDDFYGTVNHKSFNYYNEINDVEKLTRNYTPSYDEGHSKVPALDYYKAMAWKYNYYFLDDNSNNDYYYKYDHAPNIDDLIEFNDFDKIQLNYKTTDIMPIDQLCFISPINVASYVEKQKLNKLLADKLFKLMKIQLPEIKIVGDKKMINIDELFECQNARYLNKCDMKFKLITFEEFKNYIN